MDWLRAGQDQASAAPIHLIGREAEIEQLWLLTSRIATGAGDALLLSGDPGVGKDVLAALCGRAGR